MFGTPEQAVHRRKNNNNKKGKSLTVGTVSDRCDDTRFHAKMAVFLWTFVSLLVACRPTCAQTTTPTADASLILTATTLASTSTPNPPAFEIDVIFPRENETYNYTSSLPIVFAFQNFSAAAALGRFLFYWDIMPYNSVEDPRPGGVTEDLFQINLAANNVSMFANDDGSPYILVNHTNPHEWVHGPAYGGRAYALQWYVTWGNIGSV
jgi:hypothetical protein